MMRENTLSNLSKKALPVIMTVIMIISCMMPNGIVMIRAAGAGKKVRFVKI